jgi:hypothetical protein
VIFLLLEKWQGWVHIHFDYSAQNANSVFTKLTTWTAALGNAGLMRSITDMHCSGKTPSLTKNSASYF